MIEENIPEGYQNTELGIIPDDWNVRELGSISKVVRGGSPRPAGDPKFFGGISIPWLTVAALTNIPESSIYVSQTIGFLTEEGAKYSRTLENGTLIIANSGATLGVAKILAVKCCANDGIAAFIDLNKDADKLFLYYVLNAKTREFREVVATGNGQPNLNTALIGLTKISLPPTIEEQKAIAQSLSDVDAQITALEQLITKKRNIKQGTIQQLLTGKKRLSGFSKVTDTNVSDNYNNTEVGIIPDDWDVNTLASITPQNMKYAIVDGPFGSNLKTIHYRKSGIPIITSGYVTDGFFKADNYLYVDTDKFNQEKRSSVSGGDIVMAKIGARCGASAIFPIHHEVGILSGNALKISVDKTRHNTYFVWQLLWNLYVTGKIELLRTTGAQPAISIATLKKYKIPLPSLPEQKAIAQVLSDMDAEIEGLEQKRDKYKAIKQGIMQELLTGKTRLL